MKRWMIAPVVVLAALLGSASSDAAAPRSIGDVFRMLGGATPVPQEWDGVWSRVDSLYVCDGPALFAFAYDDTMCGGGTFDPGGTTTYDCTGTATATSIDMTCTGTEELAPDCQMTSTIHMVMTRTSESYHSVATISQVFVGSGQGCEEPTGCLRIVSDGTRSGPAPADYCVTPVRRHTWGQLKSIYR